MKIIQNAVGLIILSICVACNGISESETISDSLHTENEIEKSAFQKVEFESLDSILITANLYEVNPDFPMMVMFHQRGFCKYEFAGIAEEFNNLGFNCLAVDLRCGGPIADQPNETWQRAVEKNKPTDFLDAEKDMIAAIDFASNKYSKPVHILGSSYSSTLAVYQALDNENVASVIAFSPGNYFFYDGAKPDLTQELIDFEKPFFFTAANDEMVYVRELVMGRQRNENQIVFGPEGYGMHGARILWPGQEGGQEYWDALKLYLEKIK